MAGRVTGSPQTTTVTIDSIGAGGEGVGRMDDGRVVFAHRTAPGDTAVIRIDRSSRRWARGSLVSLDKPSELRRPPPCEYYDRCGGCSLEHMEYAAQLQAKGRIVRDALQRIGGFEVTVPEVVASPEEFRYRNRVSFSLRRLASGRVIAGFHELNHPGRIVDIGTACLLPEQPIATAWGELRSTWGNGAALLPPGRELRLTLRATRTGDVSLLVEAERSGGDPEALLDSVSDLRAIWIDTGAGPLLAAGQAVLQERWGGRDLEVSGAAFLQVNRGAAQLLEDHVLELAGGVAGIRAIDAYCGAGLHAARLAERGAAVVAIELDPEAAQAARTLCGPEVRIIEGRVEEALANHLPADLVIVNPPRGGLDPAAAATLAAQPPGRLIYVSCDPATLARDLQRLGPSARLASLKCFDLFPQTAHVETVALLHFDSPAGGQS